MVDLPPELLQKAFDDLLKRGVIIRLQDYPLPSGPRDKFFVVLNVDCSQEDIYHFLTTSKVNRFQKLRWGRTEGVLIQAGTLPKMPLETMVDCHTTYKMRRVRLVEAYRSGVCEFVGALPVDALAEVDRIIMASRSIPLDIKRAILPSAV